MTITPRHFADALVLKIEGRLDHETSGEFLREYSGLTKNLSREVRGVVLDLSGLDYISSSGLKVFMQLAREARTEHRRVLATGLQPMILEIFAMAHLGLLVQIFPTMREAIEAVSLDAAGAVGAASSPGETPDAVAGQKRIQIFLWFKYDAALNSSGPHSPRGTREAIERIGALPYQESAMWVALESVDGEGFYKNDRGI